MKRSEVRLLTTHTGSLPRPPVLRDLLVRLDRGEAVDRAALTCEADVAVRRRGECGVGEAARPPRRCRPSDPPAVALRRLHQELLAPVPDQRSTLEAASSRHPHLQGDSNPRSSRITHIETSQRGTAHVR